MKDKTKKILFCLLAVFAINQLVHTYFNVNSWPICSYNMFSTQLLDIHDEYMVELTEDDGTVQVVPVGACFPIEYYRLNGMVWEALAIPLEEDRESFFRGLLDRMNTEPWNGFDEVLPSARPTSGEKFTKLSIYTFRYNLKAHKVGTELVPFDKITEYSFTL